MSETKRYMPFWGEFLLFLLLTSVILALAIYDVTKESLLVILIAIMVAPLILGIFFVAIEEYDLRLEKRGFLGFLLIFVSSFITDWLWVKLSMVLLGGTIMLYDVASKRNISDEELEE